MSDPQGRPRSGNSSALNITYLEEKNWFAGHCIGAILYGARKGSPADAFARTRAHFVCSVYSRDARCAVLQMYGSTV